MKTFSSKLKLNVLRESVNDAEYIVQPLYIVPFNHDGRFQTTFGDSKNSIEDAMMKIDLSMNLAQVVIGEKLKESMKSERNFVQQKCEEFQSEITVEEACKMSQWELYDFIAAELVKKNDVRRKKFVGFLSCTNFKGLDANEEYSYANIKKKTSANPALGGGFLCLTGSGCFYSWPSHVDDVIPALSNKMNIDISQVLDDSNYRKTYGGCFATSLGNLIHEMGHIFELAHTETGLMGNDIDFIHRFFLAENLTEILPKRIVKSCQLTEQKETLKITSSKLTKLKKPGGEFLEKYREQKNNDMTFFEENCLITLFNHRWFTQTTQSSNQIQFIDETRTLFSSKSPLKLVEIRELSARNSMLVKFYSLMDKNVNEFAIPSSLKNVSLFAITSDGDIFKRDF